MVAMAWSRDTSTIGTMFSPLDSIVCVVIGIAVAVWLRMKSKRSDRKVLAFTSEGLELDVDRLEEEKKRR